MSSSFAAHARRIGDYLRKQHFDVCFLNHSRAAQAAISMLPKQVIVIPIIHNDLEEVYAVGCANSESWNVAVAVGHKVFRKTREYTAGRPVVEIPHGLETPSRCELELKDLLSSPLRAIFVGRLLHCHKGILLLPEILDGCRRKGIDLSLTVVGDGPDRQALLDKAAAFNVLDLLDCKGALPFQQVYAEMGDAHVLLLPSFFEGLPMVLLEAMAYGCVPIVSRLPGITDFVIEDSKNGFLIETGNIDAFISAIAHVFHDRMKLRLMSAASRLIIEERFTADAMAKAYVDLVSRAQRGEFVKIWSSSRGPTLHPTLIDPADQVSGKFPLMANYARALLKRSLPRVHCAMEKLHERLVNSVRRV